MIRNWSLKFHYFTTIYVEWNDKTAFRLYLANLSSNWLFWHIVVSARLTRMLLNYHITRDLINIPSVLSVDFVWWCSNWQMAKVKKCSYVIVNTESKEGKKWILTVLKPRLSLPWMQIASSICKISDSIVVTRSRTSGVLTKRTNLNGTMRFNINC